MRGSEKTRGREGEKSDDDKETMEGNGMGRCNWMNPAITRL